MATALPSRKIKTSIENQGEYKQALMFLNNSKKSTVNDEDDLWDREVSVWIYVSAWEVADSHDKRVKGIYTALGS